MMKGLLARPSFLDSLIGEGPEVLHDARQDGGFQQALSEKYADEILARIRRACGADATDPAKPSWHGGKINALGVHAYAESPASLEPTLAVAEEHLHAFLLCARQMIHCHKFDRRRRKDAHAPIPAFAEHHTAEGEIVIGGRNEPAAT